MFQHFKILNVYINFYLVGIVAQLYWMSEVRLYLMKIIYPAKVQITSSYPKKKKVQIKLHAMRSQFSNLNWATKPNNFLFYFFYFFYVQCM